MCIMWIKFLKAGATFQKKKIILLYKIFSSKFDGFKKKSAGICNALQQSLKNYYTNLLIFRTSNKIIYYRKENFRLVLLFQLGDLVKGWFSIERYKCIEISFLVLFKFTSEEGTHA